jgi:hypothetical protein
MKNFIIFLVGLSLVSCSYRPIFDPNDHYKAVGEKKAQQDYDVCKKEADEYLDQYKAERAGKEAVRKGVIGAFFGAVFGLLTGNVKSVVKSAAVGAGIGAAYGGLSVAGEGKVTPDKIKQRYVSRCLADKGYSVIGWR